MAAIRRHLSYANVAATLALVFAMSGSAVAMSHYLINSTKQINPKVLKQLEGATGRTGAPGLPGAPGAPGREGVQGREGPQGAPGGEGQAASVPSTLPSGQSESGTFGSLPLNSTSSGMIADTITFTVPLAAPIAGSNVIFTGIETPVEHCAGAGHADPGYLCVYTSFSNAISAVETEIYDVEVNTISEESAGRFGALLQWHVKGKEAFDVGTYTVTAP